jgi:hypothetical protein
MDSNPLVHVLVINWNGKEHLRDCFESLLDSSYSNVRFVLVDNGSEDGSVEFVKAEFDDARIEFLELGENADWAGGNNAGMERALDAGADYVLLLNNDTWTDPDAISRLVEMAEADASVGALSPKLVLFDTPWLLNSVGLTATLNGGGWDLGLGRIDGPAWDHADEIVGVCGAGFFVRAEALRKTGLLPTEFEIYLDDLDLSLRIWNAGYTIRFCSESVIRHKFSATMGTGIWARRKYYLNTRNRAYIVLRNFPAAAMLGAALRYGLGECKAVGRALRNGEWWKVWAHEKSWLAGAAYIPKAIVERRRRRSRGLGMCRFWSLMRRDLLFFSGVELPEEGWYKAIEAKGFRVRPMSSCARYHHAGGRLRVVQVNCYPEIGPLEITVTSEGKVLATLETTDCEELTLDAPAGLVTFHASRIFYAEQTGEPVDLGGWIGLESQEGAEG